MLRSRTAYVLPTFAKVLIAAAYPPAMLHMPDAFSVCAIVAATFDLSVALSPTRLFFGRRVWYDSRTDFRSLAIHSGTGKNLAAAGAALSTRHG